MTPTSKFYAVKRGRIVGVYRSWEKCLKQIKDFPHPVYKCFTNITDAIDFVNWSNEDKLKFRNSGRANVYYSVVPVKAQKQNLNNAISSIQKVAFKLKKSKSKSLA